MASDDHGPFRARGPIGEVGDSAVRVTDEAQAARWRTLSPGLPEIEVRERVRRALASLSPRDPVIRGSENARGFVIMFRKGRQVRAAEVDLAPWEGGTQVHVALPAEHKAKDLVVLTNWLNPVLGIFGAAEE